MATPAPRQGNHAKRVIVAAVALSVVATTLVAVLGGRFLPPGNGSTQATEQVFDNTWMTAILTPFIVLLAVFFAYVLTQFRHREGALVDGPPLRDDPTVRVWWIVGTSVTVLFLAGFGTYELLQNGSGGGQGPSPIAIPKGKMLPVQVIAQQWQFTYRYPTYGGVETPQLVLPANTYVELHVTSLDAIHSFWATELGIKADANPGVDNVAYLQTKSPRTFHVRCAELCGLWHGYMFNNGRVVPRSQFAAWIKSQTRDFSAVSKYLPKYSKSYYPDPQRRAG
ncbi:MAG: cytochrome c oxidase subunit II [Gaiellaceae bacterium]